jgi:uncharacterized protein YndB with AHSA1/START domain
MADSAPVTVSRRIAAPADQIFAILADPNRHTEFDGTDMLRGVASGEPISAVGDRFVMNMYFDHFGGPYTMDNHVVEFEPGRRIAWAPAAGDDKTGRADAIGEPVGHRWVFDLAADGDATVVTETYDCSAAPEQLQKAVNGGEHWRAGMDATLVKLEELATA